MKVDLFNLEYTGSTQQWAEPVKKTPCSSVVLSQESKQQKSYRKNVQTNIMFEVTMDTLSLLRISVKRNCGDEKMLNISMLVIHTIDLIKM